MRDLSVEGCQAAVSSELPQEWNLAHKVLSYRSFVAQGPGYIFK